MFQPLSYLEISRRNLLHNLKQFKSKLPKGSKLALVVKANAYGHGLKEIVSITNKEADYFQVDDLEELKAIRQFTKKPVLVFGYIQKRDLAEALNYHPTLGVYNLETLQELNKLGQKSKTIINIHLKIDVLHGRQGILPADLPAMAVKLKRFAYLKVEAIYGHFSDADSKDGLRHSQKQLKTLVEAQKVLSESLGYLPPYHLSASAGFIIDQKHNWGSCILRLGISLYGLWPSPDLKNLYGKKITLKPVLNWKTKIAQIKTLPANHPIGYNLTFVTKKDTKVAIIPQGYSDGYDRGFSNNDKVLIRGQFCPILGRVAMNMFVVDITHLKKVSLEDEVVLIGKQQTKNITADDLAKTINTINYEIVARISPLLPRIIKLSI